MEVHVETGQSGPSISAWLEEQVSKITQQLALTTGWVTVMVVDDWRMRELAGRYRGEHGPTDVLSFDQRDDSPGVLHHHVEADLVLCLDQARGEAERRGHPLEHELLLYALHGLLHLVGEDDHDASGYDRMHQREDQVLRETGIGPVFGHGQSGARPDSLSRGRGLSKQTRTR